MGPFGPSVIHGLPIERCWLLFTFISMSSNGEEPNAAHVRAATFATTHWSVVLAAVDSKAPEFSQALETLCVTYWYPLYAFIRHNGHGPEDARDLTQGFFEFLLKKRLHQVASADRGRFRTFLLASVKNYLMNKHRESSRQKRGGGVVHLPLEVEEAEERYEQEGIAGSGQPDVIYDREWAAALLDKVLDRLRDEYEADGLLDRFEVLSATFVDRENARRYRELAEQLHMSESGVKSAAFRLRRRFRELFRQEVGALVENPLDLDAEVQHLMNSLS